MNISIQLTWTSYDADVKNPLFKLITGNLTEQCFEVPDETSGFLSGSFEIGVNASDMHSHSVIHAFVTPAWRVKSSGATGVKWM